MEKVPGTKPTYIQPHSRYMPSWCCYDWGRKYKHHKSLWNRVEWNYDSLESLNEIIKKRDLLDALDPQEWEKDGEWVKNRSTVKIYTPYNKDELFADVELTQSKSSMTNSVKVKWNGSLGRDERRMPQV